MVIKMTEMEKKIRTLENEIARLKRENELQNRLEHIKSMAEKRDMSREEEINNLIHEYADLKMDIDELLPRILNMLTVSKCLKENGYIGSEFHYYGISLYNNNSRGVSMDCVINSGNLHDGFVQAKPFKNVETEDWDLNVENWFYEMLNNKGHGHEWRVKYATNMLNAMKEFVNNFDKFENKFYEYAENPRER